MAVVTKGFALVANQLDATRWSRFNEIRGGYKHVVASGFDTTAAAGTRAASVSAGTACAPGLLIDSDTAVTTSHSANGGSVNRVDYVVLESDWTSNTTAVVVVTGSSPSAPALTQTAGSLWQLPLARVTVRPGVTTLLSTDVVICKPLPRIVQASSVALSTATRAGGSAAFTVATVTFPDPGWPYRLSVSATARFQGSSSGSGVINVLANGASIGEGAVVVSASGNQSAYVTARSSAVLTGPATVLAQIRPSGMSGGDNLTLPNSASNSLNVELLPA